MSLPVLPEWATQDIQNDESGQFNVVEPPPEKKLAGWALGEKPNRQWWNWLQRQTYLCLDYLFTQVATIDANINNPATAFSPVVNGLDNIDVNLMYYSRQGDRVFIQYHLSYVGNTLTSPISFGLPFPANDDTDFLQYLSVSRAGAITLPNGLALSAEILSSATFANLHGENLTTGTGSAVSGIAGNGQLCIHGFYYAEPL